MYGSRLDPTLQKKKKSELALYSFFFFLNLPTSFATILILEQIVSNLEEIRYLDTACLKKLSLTLCYILVRIL